MHMYETSVRWSPWLMRPSILKWQGADISKQELTFNLSYVTTLGSNELCSRGGLYPLMERDKKL